MKTSSDLQLPLNTSEQGLEGVIERLTFYNEDTGYTVARLREKNSSQKITIVGILTGVNAGETVKLKGSWTRHPRFGRQFEVESFSVQLPSTQEGIEKYLGSGMIRGIGPVTAKRIVDYFGKESIDIISNEPERLMEVPSIGLKRTRMITKAWEEQKQIKDLMIFLQSYGVSTSLAIKIYHEYGDNAVNVLKDDPYRLAKDIFGVGFKTADKVALNLGLPENAPARIQAGLVFVLQEITNDGHCFAQTDDLISKAKGLIAESESIFKEQLENLGDQKQVIIEGDFIYLPPYYTAEHKAADNLLRICNSPSGKLGKYLTANWDEINVWLDKHSEVKLTDQQKTAIKMALTHKVSILTGGPGTGKSTIAGGLIRLVMENHDSVLLAAPTGRAAKRLSEATGLDAKTIHRLLEYSPRSDRRFKRNINNPLVADLIIIDETSMVDILIFNHLLDAVENQSHILFVGDVDQLPSVGPGNVLRDMIDSDAISFVRLDTIFRQAEDSLIVVNAHRINRGQMPQFRKDAKDFFLFSEGDPQKAADWVLDIVSKRIKAKFGFDPYRDIQVLSPMHRGAAGVIKLNQDLQEKLNPPAKKKTEYRQGLRIFREGDRVMQIRNNYDKVVFNGDIGELVKIDLESQIIEVNFDTRGVPYDFGSLNELTHAYAISIHKSQGSEFPVVVIPILTQHFLLLQRNLLYTAITRAKKMVVLVGSKKAIAIAVKNDKTNRRNTRLAQLISNTL